MLLTRGVLLLFELLLVINNYNTAATLCFGGRDVFTSVRENSPMGALVANLSVTGDPDEREILLELTGDDADWFYLDGRTIRLNSTLDQGLDREVHGPVLKAAVSCYENETLQSENGLVVEILNENDNEPIFMNSTIRPQNISELTAVNTVVFALQASDADGDTIIYKIDESSPDAEYFRTELPNSGQVLLNKPLDYESQLELHLRVYAVEMNTKEHLNATATLVVHVLDGDDHYPQFLPCAVLPLSGGAHVCANPVYTTNITERDQDIVLDFYPGPVRAVDGDKGLNTPLVFSILSGGDNGRFLIDSTTGEITLTRPVENRLLTPSMRLRIMAAQVDDLKKYSVATAIVRVVAENRFPPQFQRLEYRAFVTETTSPASFVLTYGNELLILLATDSDFPNGMNPKIQYSLETETDQFSVTKEGFLIARGKHPKPPHTHRLEVLATDLESGDVAKASIRVTVLHRGQPVPHSPLGEDAGYGQGSPGRAVGVMGVCLILLGGAVCVLVRWLRRRKRRQDPGERASVAQGKHPNVVNHGRPVPLLDEVSLHCEALSGFDASQSVLHGKAGVYTVTERVSSSTTPISSSTTPTAAPGPASSAIRSNGKASDKPVNKSVSFHHEVIIRAGNAHQGERDGGVNTHPERDGGVNTHHERDGGVNTHPERGAAHTHLLPTSTGSSAENTHKAEDSGPGVAKQPVLVTTISSLASQTRDQEHTARLEESITNTGQGRLEAGATLEQSRPDQSTPEQPRPDQSTPEQSRPNQSTLEQSRPNQSTLEQSRPDQSTPEQSRPDQSTPEQSRPDQSTLEQSRPDQSTPEQSRPNQSTLEQSSPNQSTLEQSSPNQSTLDQSSPNQSTLEQSRPNQSTLEQSRPEYSSKSDTPKPDHSKPDDPTSEKSKSDTTNPDGSNPARGEGAPEVDPPHQADPPPGTTQDQTPAEKETGDASGTPMERIEEECHPDVVMADEAMADDPQPSDTRTDDQPLPPALAPDEAMTSRTDDQPLPPALAPDEAMTSRTDDQPLPPAHTPGAQGEGSNPEMLHRDGTEKTRGETPNPSTDAAELAAATSPPPTAEAHQTHSSSASTHSRDDTLTHPDTPTSTGLSSQEKTTDAVSQGTVNTGSVTNTGAMETGVSDKSPQGGERTASTEPGAYETGVTNTNTNTPPTGQDRNTTNMPMPDIVITGSTDDAEDDADTEKFTKITNLDDDVTDTTGSDAQ